MRIERIPVLAGVAVALLLALALVWLRPALDSAGDGAKPIEFTTGDFVFSQATEPPRSGWARHAFPTRKLLGIAHEQGIASPTVWTRFRFDRARFSGRPIALFAATIQQDFVLLLNSREIYRTHGDRKAEAFGWNRPLYLTLPPDMLRARDNEILLRITTHEPQPLIVGVIRVGPDEAVRARFDRELFFATIAPQVVTGYLLILTIGALTFWFKRPREVVFGWLALVGVVWLFRDLHYFVPAPPFAANLYWAMTTDSLFVLLATASAFALCYFRVHDARRRSIVLAAACGMALVLRHGLAALHRSELPAFLVAGPVALVLLVLLAQATRRDPQPGRWLMFAAIVASIGFAFHDLGWSIDVWRGAGVALHPFGGLLIFIAFDITLTTRLQDALFAVESDNQSLEVRVAEVTTRLQTSEASRAQLQIALAIDSERERIMREIHDGIGSNLVTALAVAQRSHESPTTIGILRRSLTDLKIAVDSLEPVDGDIVALLANLRHRMEGDIHRAGLAMEWNVEACPPLAWLNPINALHVLRIIQEAIGNVLTHAAASTITIACAPEECGERTRIIVSVGDDGTAFGAEVLPGGGHRGLANMAARAEAIGGEFAFSQRAGGGSLATLILPA